MADSQIITILFISDENNQMNMQSILKLLSKKDFKIYSVKSFSEAKKYLSKIQVILYEVHEISEEGNLKNFLKDIKSIPLITVVSKENVEIGRTFNTIGASDYLVLEDLNAAYLEKVIKLTVKLNNVQNKLQINNDIMNTALKASDNSFIAIDNHGKVIKYNSVFSDIWKIPRPTLSSGDAKKIFSFMISGLKNSEKVSAKLKFLLNNPQSTKEEICLLIMKNGMQVECYSVPIINNTDIVGRVFISKGLFLKSEKSNVFENDKDLIKTAIEATKIGYWDFHPQSNAIYLSPSCHSMLGYDIDEIPATSQTYVRLIHDEDKDKALKEFYEQTQIKDYLKTEFRMKAKSGEWNWISINGKVVERNGEQKPIRVIGTSINITPLKTTEEQLRKSEQKYRQIIDGANYGIAVLQEGKHKLFNTAMEKITGYSQKELADITLFSAISEEDRKMILEEAKKRPKGISSEYELQITQKDKTKKWIHVNIKPIEWDGEIASLALVKDISKRKKIENELKESEKRLKLALEATSDGLWDLYVKTGASYYNDRYFTMLGYKKEDFTDHSFDMWKSLLHPDDRKKSLKVVKNYIADFNKGGNPNYELEFRMRCKSGEYKWILSRGRVVETDKKGKPIRMTGTHIDVTLRKEMEKALKESEEKYRDLVERAQDGITILQDEVLKFVNPSLADMLGYTLEELQGIHFSKVVPLEMVKYISDRLIRRLSGEKLKSIYESQLLKKNGEAIDIEYNAGVINYMDKPADLIMVRDITERKKLEAERENLIVQLQGSLENEQAAREEMEAAFEEAQAANEDLEESQLQLRNINEKLEKAVEEAQEASKLKSEFLAIISHELRTPLNGMLGFSQLMTMDKSLNDEQKHNADLINKSGRRLLQLLSDLLEISVIEAGRINIKYSEFDICKLIDDIFLLLKDNFEQKNVSFSFNSHNIRLIKTDISRVRQILFNLIGNAIKFTESGSVKVKLSTKKKSYLFEIDDTGIGIEKDKLDIIFESFRQAEESSKRHYQGVGLGLSICKKLVNALGGKIWVKSKPNKGSDFFVEIPIADIYSVRKNEATVPREKAVSKKLSVLFAEDDEINFSLIEKLIGKNKKLNGKGFKNGETLLDEIKSNKKYDIIILDIQMPKMNGVECLKEIRKINTKVKVIALTAYAAKEDKERFLESGFNDFITKPIKVDEFYQIIDENTQSIKD